MPRVKNRNRNCNHCKKAFTLGDPSTYTKYCSVQCRNRYHNNKQGTKYRNSEKGKNTMFAWRLRSQFNLSVDEYNNMLKNQQYSCAICETTEPTGYGWHVDHCHKSGKVRGILCSKCNQGLGLFSDNTKHLNKAINYLENWTD